MRNFRFVLFGVSLAMLIIGVVVGYGLGIYQIYGFPSYPSFNAVGVP